MLRASVALWLTHVAAVVSAELTLVTPDNAVDFPDHTLHHEMLRLGTNSLTRGTVIAPLVHAMTVDSSDTIVSPAAAPALHGCPALTLATNPAAASSYRIAMVALAPNCSVADQVRQVESFQGVVGVLFYNSTAEMDAPDLPSIEAGGIITPGDIPAIPAASITNKDAAVLQRLLNVTGSTVVLQLRWATAVARDHVEIGLHTSSTSSSLSPLLASVASIVSAFDPSTVHFTPHFEVYPASEWGCDSHPLNDNCQSLCVDDAFCTYDPDNDPHTGYSGADMLLQHVRQWCVNQLYPAANYFGYAERVAATCTPENRTCFTDDSALDMARVQQCVDANKTTVWQHEAQRLVASGMTDFPFLTVDDQPLYDTWSCAEPIAIASCSMLALVCNHFGYVDATNLPAACDESFWSSRCNAPFERDDCGVCQLRDSIEWNRACHGCDGVFHSNKTVDVCGVCGGDGSFDICGQCLPASDPHRDRICSDCMGVPWGDAKLDPCGKCGGHGSFDACGLCFDATDPRRQNYHCVVDDFDTESYVRVKYLVQGLPKAHFEDPTQLNNMLSTVASLMGLPQDQVHVKSIESVGDKAVAIYIFGSAASDQARATAMSTLNSTAAMDTLATAVGSNNGLVGVKVLSLRDSAAVSAVEAWAPSTRFYVISGVGMVLSMLATTVLLRRRDSKLKREMQTIMSRYAPLVQSDNGDFDFD